MLSVIYIVCCLPIFTIGTATTSLYYSTVKCIRRDRSSLVKEFFGSFRRTFAKGSISSLIIIATLAILFYGRVYSLSLESNHGSRMALLYLILMILVGVVAMYLFPVLSRFQMKLSMMWKLAFVMSIRFFPITVALVVGSVGLVYLFIWFLPAPCILFVPGLWCLVISFMMEKALLHYMPKPKEDEDAWYYPTKKTDKQDNPKKDFSEKR